MAHTTNTYRLIFNPHVRRSIGYHAPATRETGDPEIPMGGWLRDINAGTGQRVYSTNPADAWQIPEGLQTLTGLSTGDTWHVPGDPSLILDCGHPESPHSEITSGYGTDREGRRHCLSCCYANDLAAMAHGPIVAYLTTAPDGSHVVTTWNGQILAHVESLRMVSCGGFLSGVKRAVWRAVGVDGKRYHGTGPGPGMYCNVRPSTDKRRRTF